MWQINSALSSVFDLLMSPFGSLHPLWSLSLFSGLTAVFILLVYRYTSDQTAIQETKDKIKAHLLEIRIFKDNLAILLSSQKKLLFHNAIYMKHSIKPLLVMIMPLALIIIQMEAWYGLRPLKPGESTVLSLYLSDGAMTALPAGLSMNTDKGLEIETPLLRIPEKGELDWRIRVKEPGTHQVTVKWAGHTFQKTIVGGEGQLARLSPLSINGPWWSSLTSPGAEALAEQPFIKKLGVQYPSRSIEIFGWKTHWLVLFFALTIVIAFSAKRFFKVHL